MFALSIAPDLELRHYELHHAPQLLGLVQKSQTHLSQFLAFANDASLESLTDFIRRSRAKFVGGEGSNFGIWRGQTLLGTVSLFGINHAHRKAEVGYWLGQPFLGQGIMPKALGALLDYAFSQLGLNRIQLCAATTNQASRRVAQKLGFTLEGVARADRVLRGERLSHEVWAMLARDWATTPRQFKKDLGNGAELRLLEPQHAPDVFAAVDSSRTHLRRFLPWVDSNTDVSHSAGFIKACMEQFGEFDGINAGIWQDGVLAGVIGMHYIDQTHLETEFGYWLREDFTGRGLVTRSAYAMLEYIFDELGLQRISIAHAKENHASRGVIERLGFVYEYTARDAEWLYERFHDWQRYGLHRTDSTWRNPQP
jgi:ribosomal-protein-serine acetyltransferase